MAVTQDVSNRAGEKDLTIHLRGLVETCFEENQYEAAIATLDEIRSSRFKPFPHPLRKWWSVAKESKATLDIGVTG
ncbi:hypothetical protein OH77DRAFT_1432553 [Trametes cingulata]|nr:hypothetical protein OH77DRAFT_1432553 [Trametes cingulata]